MQATVSPSRVASPSNVRLEASLSRPVTAISPRPMMSATTSSSMGSDAGSADGTAVVTVQPRADVAFCVERVVAQRARRPPGSDDQLGVLGEVAGLAERQEHPQSVRPLLAVLENDVLADLFL